jgi:large subunit ribosomal protein L24
MNKIRKGDEVVVIAGKDKGRRGTVTRVFPDQRVLVEGVNLVKKHQRPNPQAGVPGGIVEKEMPMSISNVMLYNPATARGNRVGIRVLEDSAGGTRKVRYFKSNGEVVDV